MVNSTVEGWSEEFRERFRVLAHRVGGMSRAADLLGYSANQMANWRDGTSSPSLFKVSRLCAAGGVTVDWLLYGTVGPLAGVDPGELRSAIATLAALQPLGGADEIVRTISVDELRSDPVFERAVSWYQKTNGEFGRGDVLETDLMNFSVVHALNEREFPEYLHCGGGSVVAAYYGSEFAANPSNSERFIVDRELEARAAVEYRNVMSSKIWRATWVSTCLSMKGERRLLRYRRIVIPIVYRGSAAVMVVARETHAPVLLG